MKNFKALTSIQLSLLVLAIVHWSSADDSGAFFNTPTTSSTYARVQYANQANLTRRFGSSRDPTIQYISFDELYNKYNKGGSKPSPAFTKDPNPIITSERTGVADDKMDNHWPEDSPNLRNGWTVERLQPEVGSSKTRVKAPDSAFNKGIDQVYAYSNAYQSGQFAKEAAPKVAPGEYAHAIEDDHQDHVVAGSDLKTNVVMETSWTDVDDEDEQEHLTTAAIDDRSDSESSAAASTTVKPKTFSTSPKRSKPDGVQSAWRPFAGPTAAPTTAAPKVKRVQKTTRPDTITTNDSEDDVLFYAEAKKAASRRPNQPATPGVVNLHPQQQFLVRPGNDQGQLWMIPNAAENEVTRGHPERTPRPFSVLPDERVEFGQPPFMHSNQHPIVLPPPSPMSQQPPMSQQRPMSQQPPNDRFQHQQGPPQQTPNERFQHQQNPPQQPPSDRFQHQQGPPQWTSVNPNFPLSRPNGPPSGPVGVAPQLLNPNGQIRPRPQQGPIQIPLPLPRPSGPLGSSPDNPLPGPPIALPGIPAFNMQNGNGRPNEPDRNQRFPPGPPQHFPDRIDGPPGPPDNFIRGPQQPFNPNGQPQFNRHNFNRPPPPPPQAPSGTSIIKSFLSRFFPFARSLDLDGIPIVDVDQLTNNGTNLTALTDAPPEVLAHLHMLTANSTSTEESADDLTTVANSTASPSNTTDLSF